MPDAIVPDVSRVCKGCREEKPIEKFRWSFALRGGEIRKYHVHTCDTCRGDKRRAAAAARGLKRSPTAIVDGEVRHTEKLCSKCGETKEISQFRIKTYGVRDGQKYPRAIATHCLTCEQEHKAHYYDRNSERFKEKQKQYNRDNKEPRDHLRDRHWRRNLRKLYGLTVDDYNRMYDLQGGKCSICSKSNPRLSVDHCHATGRVRGLLCKSCNLALGNIKEDPAATIGMLNYIVQNCSQIRSVA